MNPSELIAKLEIHAQTLSDLANDPKSGKLVIQAADVIRKQRADIFECRVQIMELKMFMATIAAEAAKHSEHNPVSGNTRLPLGYSIILETANHALETKTKP